MLLRDLTIENFRSFDHYRLNNLARVNLLVGDNNCGKTSVLEAAHLVAGHANIGDIFQYLDERDERTPIPSVGESRQRYLYHVKAFFRQTDPLMSTNNADAFLICATTDDGQDASVRGAITQKEGAYQLSLAGTGGRSGNSSRKLDSLMRAVGDGVDLWVGPVVSGRKPYIPRTSFISGGNLEISKLRAGWADIQRESREHLVIAALRTVLDSLSDIRFQPETESRHDIFLDLNERRVPLSQLGFGTFVMLAIAVSLVESEGGTSFIDEIDTGLHYSRIPAMWEFLIRTAKELNVQVFATTHSLDCLNGLEQAVRADEDLAGEVAVHRIEREILEAVTLSGEEFLRAMSRESEIR